MVGATSLPFDGEPLGSSDSPPKASLYALTACTGPRSSALRTNHRDDWRLARPTACSLPCIKSAICSMSASLAAVVMTVCTRPLWASTVMCAFMPKCHRLPFLVWCISGSRSPSVFFVELGAAMMVASTMLPFLRSRPLRAQVRVDRLENVLGQVVGFEQVAKVQDRRLVRDRLAQTQVSEGAPRGNLVQRLFHRRVAQRKPVLHQVHAQHRRQRVRSAAASGGRVNGSIRPSSAFHGTTSSISSRKTRAGSSCACRRTRRPKN